MRPVSLPSLACATLGVLTLAAPTAAWANPDLELPGSCRQVRQGAATSTSVNFSFGPQPTALHSGTESGVGLLEVRANNGAATLSANILGASASALAGQTRRATFTYNATAGATLNASIPWGQIGGGDVCTFGLLIEQPGLVARNRRPQFRGYAPAGVTVTVSSGGVARCSAVTDGAGIWTCQPETEMPRDTTDIEATGSLSGQTLRYTRPLSFMVNPCPAGTTDCVLDEDRYVCADVLSSPDHCGGCFIPVDDGNACTMDRCEDGVVVNEDTVSDTCADDGFCDTEVGACVCFEGFGGPNCRPMANCGDGVLDEGEACDDGINDGSSGCTEYCDVVDGYICDGEPGQVSVCEVWCGDGVIFGDEACDDGNSVSGDGCSSSCTVEPGFRCSGEPSECVSTVTPPVDPPCSGDECDPVDPEPVDPGDDSAGAGKSSGCAQVQQRGGPVAMLLAGLLLVAARRRKR